MTSIPRLIASVTNDYGRPVHYYDNGTGSLYLLRDSTGIVGLVRASTWEEAYDIAEDELFPEADQTWEEIAKELECPVESLMDDACFQEAYGFRPNGPNKSDKLNQGIYQRDLNGEWLDKFSESNLLKRYGIAITWKDWE
jgi:hypothetical protein